MKKRGFDAQKYTRLEKREILKRISHFGKLYLEIGGKVCHDFHASRVLPGYHTLAKLHLLKQLKEKEIIYCISAKDLEEKRVIHDFDLTVDKHALHDFSILRKFGLKVDFVVIALFSGQPAALKFKRLLEKKGYNVYLNKEINGYPSPMSRVLSGFEAQEYVPSRKKLTLIAGAASGSGKMRVALSQIYRESKNGMKTGFAKLETFPIWNLPLAHPINLAYEAATADLNDENIIDSYYKKAYGKEVVNYNRDINNFSVLKEIMRKMKVSSFRYKSPTDMGINMAGFAISDDEVCRKAAIREIMRRYEQYSLDYKKGREKYGTIKRMGEILKKIGKTP